MAYTTINDPSAYFQSGLYTGNGGTQSITNDGNSNLQPDWVWIKGRSDADNNSVFDTTRGANKELVTNGNGAEATGTNLVTSFDSNGFSLGNNGGVNGSGDTYVGWQWKANGGTTSSNSDGSITSTVQANTTAGFSIVTYTGNNTSGATVGHGLGAAPDTIILKARGVAGQNWFVNTPVGGGVGYMMLNQENADSGSNSSVWNSTSPTSTVFTLGNSGGVNDSTTYVAYCFKPIKGYSKMGNYTGNNNNDGPFVYTGFKPAWVMIKNTSATSQWPIIDAARDPFNVTDARLRANTNAAEATETFFDFLSNGFKVRSTGTDKNDNGNSYFYMAFAQNPLVASNNVIALAR